MAQMKPDEIRLFFSRLRDSMPAPKSELEYDNPYQLLVAVVLSAQATDAGVNRATEPLFQIIKTPGEMVALGERKLIGYIKSIGLFRTKAKNVIALSRLLIEKHGGQVPAVSGEEERRDRLGARHQELSSEASRWNIPKQALAIRISRRSQGTTVRAEDEMPYPTASLPGQVPASSGRDVPKADLSPYVSGGDGASVRRHSQSRNL